MFTYLKLSDLPQVPEHLEAQALEVADQNAQNTDESLVTLPEGFRFRKVSYQGEEFTTRCQVVCTMDEEWHQWVKDNITPDYLETGVRVNNDNGSPVHGPHADPPEPKYKLFYLIETGGRDVKTEWYVEPGQPLMRDPGTNSDDFSKVQTIDSINIPLRTWILFNTNILHGIRNLESRRVNLAIGIAPDHPMITKYLV